MVQHILEIISRDEIAMDVTYQEAREHDNLKEGRATKRRRRDGPSSQAPIEVSRVSGAICRKRSIESRVDITESWFHCFTSRGYLGSCFGFCVCCLGRFFCLFAICATRYFFFLGV